MRQEELSQNEADLRKQAREDSALFSFLMNGGTGNSILVAGDWIGAEGGAGFRKGSRARDTARLARSAASTVAGEPVICREVLKASDPCRRERKRSKSETQPSAGWNAHLHSQLTACRHHSSQRCELPLPTSHHLCKVKLRELGCECEDTFDSCQVDSRFVVLQVESGAASMAADEVTKELATSVLFYQYASPRHFGTFH